jgi:hypothetical protein
MVRGPGATRTARRTGDGPEARLQELCGVALEDVTETHIVLRATKRRPGGLRVERSVPLSAVCWACKELVALCPGRNNNLIGAYRRTVQARIGGVASPDGHPRVQPQALPVRGYLNRRAASRASRNLCCVAGVEPM